MSRNERFNEVYRNELVPIFNAFEVKRQKDAVLAKFFEYTGNAAGVLFILCVAVLTVFTETSLANSQELASILNLLSSVVIPLVILAALFKCIASNMKRNFAKMIKKECFPRILKIFGTIEASDTTFSDRELGSSFLFSDYNVKNTDDTLVGKYKDVDFKVSEVELKKISYDSKGRKRESKVFKGLVSSFSANKNFQGKTVIASKYDSTALPVPTWLAVLFLVPFLVVGCGLIYKNPSSVESYIPIAIPVVCVLLMLFGKNAYGLEKVELEDPELRKNFVVYSNAGQVEARYLLTPTFIERFKNLQTAFGSKKLKCSFFDNQVMFAISSNKNFFEIGHLYNSLHNPETVERFYEEISSIYAMIRHFKFDEKTGL